MEFRYSRWDGTQQVMPFDPDELMAAMSEDLIANGDIMSALQRLMQSGLEGDQGRHLMGLQELIERLKAARQQQLSRYDMNSIMDDIRARLEEIIRLEREGIDRRVQQARQQRREPAPPEGAQSGDASPSASEEGEGERPEPGARAQAQQPQGQQGAQSPQGQRQASQGQQAGQRAGQQGPTGEAGLSGSAPSAEPGQDQEGDGDPSPDLQRMLEQIAARKRQFLDQLPPDVPGRIRQLSEYDFMDEQARQKFQELLQLLQQQVMQQFAQGLQQQIQSLTPQDLQRLRDMLRDLNRMLDERRRGGQPDFQEFKEKWGDFFPGVESLDQLMQQMAQRAQAMQRLLESMSPEQRRQLEQALQNAFGDPGLQQELAELASHLQRMMPWRARGPLFRGDEPISLEAAMEVMRELQQLDALERQIRAGMNGEDLDQIDAAELQRLLGDDARASLEELKRLIQTLEEAGYVRRSHGELELTARGMRKIGEKALTDIFRRLQRDRFGKHNIEQRGFSGERLDESKPYEFGDPFLLDIQQTVMNALIRDGAGTPVRLQPSDFAVYRTEYATEASTVLMLDMSRSMLLRGCFLAAKKVALALHALIKGQFPRDNLYIIGFSYYARELQPEALPAVTWSDYAYGTNMQHGFMLARQLLNRRPARNKQIILITDGEPTAHFEGDIVDFNYPPTARTFQETLREVGRCTRDRIIINTFMLERGYYLTDFINQMTAINKGRAFFAEPDRLGEYILVDYVNNKRKRIVG